MQLLPKRGVRHLDAGPLRKVGYKERSGPIVGRVPQLLRGLLHAPLQKALHGLGPYRLSATTASILQRAYKIPMRKTPLPIVQGLSAKAQPIGNLRCRLSRIAFQQGHRAPDDPRVL